MNFTKKIIFWLIIFILWIINTHAIELCNSSWCYDFYTSTQTEILINNNNNNNNITLTGWLTSGIDSYSGTLLDLFIYDNWHFYISRDTIFSFIVYPIIIFFVIFIVINLIFKFFFLWLKK